MGDSPNYLFVLRPIFSDRDPNCIYENSACPSLRYVKADASLSLIRSEHMADCRRQYNYTEPWHRTVEIGPSIMYM